MKPVTIKALVCFAAIFVFGSYSLVAQNITIKGSIHDSETGTPLELADIYIQLENKTIGCSSTEDGFFELKNVPQGNHTLIVSYVGYFPVQQQINTYAKSLVDLKKIYLKPNVIVDQALTIYGKSIYQSDPDFSLYKLKSSILESPQSIQILSSSLLELQQVTDMNDGALRTVSGVQNTEHFGTYTNYYIHSFRAPTFRNGLNTQNSWGPLPLDASFIQNIEVIKGAASFLQANAEAGGMINVVTKKATGLNHLNVGLGAGSFNRWNGNIDLNRSLNKHINYRLNASLVNTESHRKFDFTDKFSIKPSLRIFPSKDKTKQQIDLEYIYQYQKSAAIGVADQFSLDGYGDLPRWYTTIDPNLPDNKIKEHSANARYQYSINQNWEIVTQAGWLANEQEVLSLWPYFFNEEGIQRGVRNVDMYMENFNAQLMLNGQFEMANSLLHKISFGADYLEKDHYADFGSLEQLGNGILYYDNPSYNLAENEIPDYNARRSTAVKDREGIAHTEYDQKSIYVNDQLVVGESGLQLNLGLRYTNTTSEEYGRTSDHNKLSPRIGLNYSVNKQNFVYALYDQSFNNVLGTDVNGEAFDPALANHFEVGYKFSTNSPLLFVNLSIYHTEKSNVINSDPDNPGFNTQFGKIRSKGIDLDAKGSTKHWMYILAASVNDAKITKDKNEDRVGRRFTGSPRFRNSLLIGYAPKRIGTEGFTITLSYLYEVDRYSWDWSGGLAPELPNYFRVDGGVQYKKGKLNLNLSVLNITDRTLVMGTKYAGGYYYQQEAGPNFRLGMKLNF